jgi:hypothetical protein
VKAFVVWVLWIFVEAKEQGLLFERDGRFETGPVGLEFELPNINVEFVCQ